ncbi:hypothetical protein LOK49_LG15G00375 [Camellia lanceoleosa]|uniref:Uncharacterized protein n=1 Tax=Camellia lanceoleosa TaxID=1840588 RepID=A0ACC0F645_9ERIC|nr:hypothetical protein LOK49_LG15G00375 [Camellia lanceoleosa]
MTYKSPGVQQQAELLICCKAETLLLQGGPKDLFQSKCMLICGGAKSSRTSVAEQIQAQTQIWADAGVLAGRFWRSLLGVVVADVVACSCCEAGLIKDLVQCLMLGLRPDLLYAAESLLLEDQMCLNFTSMSKLEGGDEVEIFITECKQIQIKKCAAKLIFEVDENNADTNDEALTDYISSPSPSAIQEEDEEVDYPTKRRRGS